MLFIGNDLAWTEDNESGLVAMREDGQIIDADWRIGSAAVADWVSGHAEEHTLVFVDAPLVITNATGQRLCEKHVGQRYWKALVSANSSNLSRPERHGGVRLRQELELRDFQYDDGIGGPPTQGRTISECYPYTTIVGAELLDYDVRPTYKRAPKGLSKSEWRGLRARVCDELITRVASLAAADPPLDLASHKHTAQLVNVPSPLDDRAYKHREDMLDAAFCAWTAALWWRHGFDACQVLGDAPSVRRPAATIIAPARAHQRH